MAELKQAVEAAVEATTRCDKATEDMFHITNPDMDCFIVRFITF
jgi:hypothetical protein